VGKLCTFPSLNRKLLALKPFTTSGVTEVLETASPASGAHATSLLRNIRGEVVTRRMESVPLLPQDETFTCSITKRCPEGTRKLASWPSVKTNPCGWQSMNSTSTGSPHGPWTVRFRLRGCRRLIAHGN